MGLLDPRDLANCAHDLLDRERAAILAGRFDVLERLTAEKERLIARLGREDAPQSEVARLRDSADRNGRLLEAMRTGLNDAAQRLEALGAPPALLHTYDANGRRVPLEQPPRPRKLRY